MGIIQLLKNPEAARYKYDKNDYSAHLPPLIHAVLVLLDARALVSQLHVDDLGVDYTQRGQDPERHGASLPT